MEELIQAVVRALGVGASIAEIHDAIIAKGWSEDDTFLAIKAGEILYKTIEEAEAAKSKRSLIRRVT
jgi:hypothetical protein